MSARVHFNVGDDVLVMSGVGGLHLAPATVVEVSQDAEGWVTYVTDYRPGGAEATTVATHRANGTADYMLHADWRTRRCGC